MELTYLAPPSPNPSQTSQATPTASTSSSTPPSSLPTTGGMPWGIFSIGLVAILIGVAIQVSMRKLRRSE